MAVRTEPLAPTWKDGRVMSWVTTVDHKRIGVLYLVTAFGFFLAAGVMAMLMRLQLSQAGNGVLEENAYNQVVTIHGTSMVFLFVVPILAGFGNYLIPLMIGARDMAFPRLNAASYWLFLLGGIVLLFSFFADGGAAIDPLVMPVPGAAAGAAIGGALVPPAPPAPPAAEPGKPERADKPDEKPR